MKLILLQFILLGIVNGNSVMDSLEPPTPPPKSLFDPYYQDLSQTCSTSTNIRPEQYNLPSQLAKQLDIKGFCYFLLLNI